MHLTTFFLIATLVAQGYAADPPPATTSDPEAAKNEFEAMKTEALAKLDQIKAAVEEIEKKRTSRIEVNNKKLDELLPSYYMVIEEVKSIRFYCKVRARGSVSSVQNKYGYDYESCIKNTAKNVKEEERDVKDIYTKWVVKNNYYLIKDKQCETTECHNDITKKSKDDISIRYQKFNKIADAIIAAGTGIDAAMDKCTYDNNEMIKELDKSISNLNECVD